MAEHMSKVLIFYECAALLGVLPVLSVSASAAEALPDPTRPPVLLVAPEDAKVAAPASPVLQSVLISPVRRVATINGQIVKIGDKIGDARVVRVAESEVVLQNGKDVQVLKLFPDVEKFSMTRHSQGVKKRTEATKVK